jgi:26S proteasome non-ATPase regulatory subunit 9
MRAIELESKGLIPGMKLIVRSLKSFVNDLGTGPLSVGWAPRVASLLQLGFLVPPRLTSTQGRRNMGFTLPDPDSPAERARALLARRNAIEAELDVQLSILRSNGDDGRTPLVDAEGFPRADIDIWAVRHARVRAIELRNDLVALTDEMAKALAGVYDPALRGTDNSEAAGKKDGRESAFAQVDSVLSGSPAGVAVRVWPASSHIHPSPTNLRSQGLQPGDLVLRFGHLTKPSFTSSLQPLAELVAGNENARQLVLFVMDVLS